MKRILLSVMSVGITGVMLGAATLAVFTASASNTGNVFSTGTLILGTTPQTGLFSVSNMQPGDSVSANLTVNNTGSLNFTYNGTATVTASDATLNETTNGLQLMVLSGLTTIYSGPLSNFAINPSRLLNAGTNETLNFTVSLPSTANNTAQNQTANATFTFNASQQ